MPETVVGLMGLGRIGRNLVRILHQRDDVRLGAISDAGEAAGHEYLLRYDTLLGRFPASVAYADGKLDIGGRQIPMLDKDTPGDVPWGELGVEVVIDASEKRRSREELDRHLAAGAKRVIVCAPSDAADATIVAGVNDGALAAEQRIVSAGSVAAHAAAPVLQILGEAFGIERAFVSAIHAYTSQLRLADVPATDMRTGRAAAENIIPQQTGLADELAGLVPSLAGKISGMALNVPVANGSVADLTCWHTQAITKDSVNEALRAALASDRWKSLGEYETGPIVSSDIKSSPYSFTFDSLATMTIGDRLSKTLSWFDNGWGYAHRVVELAQRLAGLERKVA